MPSPFPGMNPYIESADIWQDFHTAFLVHCREQLRGSTKPDYIVKLEETVYIHENPDADDDRRLLGRPDISVTLKSRSSWESAESDVATLPAPVQASFKPEVDTRKLRRIEIRDRQGRDLITVIELLSPTNKRPGADREVYIAKRRSLLKTPVHFVEIDLLRAYDEMPMVDLPSADYRVIVSRAEKRPQADVWPIRLRDTLPAIPIPLKSPDPDLQLDLMAALHHVHDSAGYADYIYTSHPQPLLHPEDARWAESLLTSRS
jgi:hypothetical protein